MLYKQSTEEDRLPVGKQDVGVPRDNSFLVAVHVETKKEISREEKGITERRILVSLSLKALL